MEGLKVSKILKASEGFEGYEVLESYEGLEGYEVLGIYEGLLPVRCLGYWGTTVIRGRAMISEPTSKAGIIS